MLPDTTFLASLETLVQEALLVNPYDEEGMIRAMRDALTMPDAKRKERVLALRERVRRRDVHTWAREFLTALRGDLQPVSTEGQRVGA